MAQSRTAMQFSVLGIKKAFRHYLIFLGERQRKLSSGILCAFRLGLWHSISGTCVEAYGIRWGNSSLGERAIR